MQVQHGLCNIHRGFKSLWESGIVSVSYEILRASDAAHRTVVDLIAMDKEGSPVERLSQASHVAEFQDQPDLNKCGSPVRGNSM